MIFNSVWEDNQENVIKSGRGDFPYQLLPVTTYDKVTHRRRHTNGQNAHENMLYHKSCHGNKHGNEIAIRVRKLKQLIQSSGEEDMIQWEISYCIGWSVNCYNLATKKYVKKH